MTTTPDRSPRTVACPACGAVAGEPCTSHGGARVRTDFHQARTAAWEAARVAAVPAAQLLADAVAAKDIRHGKHAAELLDASGFAAEAERVRRAVTKAHGLMSARQAIALLIDQAEDGENR